MASVPRGPRIGSTVSQAIDRAFPTLVAPHPNKTEDAREREFDFEEFADCPLIYRNVHAIREEFISGKKTTKHQITMLRTIRAYILYYEDKFNCIIASSEDVSVSFCVEFIIYCTNRLKTAAHLVRYCWRFLKIIGVPTDVIPPNPLTEPISEPREELDERKARHFLNRAKQDARVIIDRFQQAEELASKGRDPRRLAGGRNGDWDEIENRLWICREVLGLQARTERDLIALGYRTIIAGLEARPGAFTIDPKLGATQQNGLFAHLRFFHPSVGDLAPFIALLMIRTKVNLQCVADIKAWSEWAEPYSRAFSHDEESERWVWIVMPKLRGAQGSKRERFDRKKNPKVAKAPARIRIPSLKTPWSHPFQVLSFVQKLTHPLREEIKRRIKELSSKSSICQEEKMELYRLQFIKDDMFVFRTRNIITSLNLQTRNSQQTPKPLLEIFQRYGLTAGVRQLRDAGLQFGFRTSGHNLLILHLLARHSNPGTAAAYARRRDFFRRSEELFVAIFDKSIALVRSSNYTIANLRKELKSSGLEDWQITNILDPNTRSRYGNRCGGPTSPPEPFNNGTPPGQLCRSQDCIDGCPLARFLPDALPFLVRQWISIKQQLGSVGVAAVFENSLQHRLNRLERILDKYPPSAVLAEREKLQK
jgi:hypothetical protein